MHEWSLAEGIILSALKFQKKNHLKKINKIILRIGELQQIDKNILKLALKEITNIKKINPKIIIKKEKAVLKCRICGYTWGFRDIKLDSERFEYIHFIPEVIYSYVRCPRCGSPDFEIIKGRGVWIETIQGLK